MCAAKQTIALSVAILSVSFLLPAGFKFNQGAPFYVAYKTSDEQAVKITASETARNFTEPKFPLEIPIEAVKGESVATIDAVIYFCNDGAQKLCLVDSVRIQLPLEVKDSAPHHAQVEVAAKAKGMND